MTAEKAKEIIKKYPNAVNFVKRSHLEELSPLLEVHIEVVKVKKSDFHALPGNTYYPKKETTDRFGNAAGISFARVDTNTRKEDDACIARAIPQEVGPDGKMIQWAPAEYEFDPVLRAEEDILRDEENAEKYNKPAKYRTDRQKKMLELQYKKVARRRADTGARAAAIISAIGMPTGFKNLFNQNDSDNAERIFLFSRVIVNSKNEMVLQRALDNMFSGGGSVDALYGNTTSTQQLEGPRDVSPQQDEGAPTEDPEDVWYGDESKTDPRQEIITELEAWLNSNVLNETGKSTVAEAVKNSNNYTTEQLQGYLDKCRAAAQKAKQGA